MRDAVRETRLEVGQLVQPLFVQEGDADEPLASLPGQTRWSVGGVVAEVRRCWALGVKMFVFFPKVPDGLKSRDGAASSEPDGLIPRVLRAVREAVPEAWLITDVALDPYSSDGHDGIVSDAGEVLNDQTVAQLVRQALCHAEAGADWVSPSDMMDGRVGAIRLALDAAGHERVGVLSYTAKYASAFYGPFRGALDSAPKSEAGRLIPADKRSYQMDPGNVREALREAALDEAEGADVLMVKPAGPYLDVVSAVRAATTLPVAAYQVSGEYLALVAAAESGWLDRRAVVLESLLGIRRAGADVILTYFASEVAAWVREGAG